ncbi:uncharacterized protein LOC111709771 isoform X1 [Eurytemora carolleeae]|uniref:uncharacterized protein LOC111709771 isoform X1 n=1 Tax=Eurytemora carolleeae TaxID=1294199 RepID=UPI000C763E24|nr:uncharacterized protein LOC111709771 isoform X1 [Eurytemora carolleeae]|eukprot:XP_023339443.1 uncharacterized protein LOC111709771 isoform X1 [Eurytemora affinis]
MVDDGELMRAVIEAFEIQLEQALSTLDLQEESKKALKQKYLQSFTNNIQFGLKKTFGECEVDSTLAAAAAVDLPAAEGTSDEVTPEDIEKMQHAMAIAASKRARYPNKGAKILKEILNTNYNLLKDLKADVSGMNIPDPSSVQDGVDPRSFQDHHEDSVEKTAKTLQACKGEFLDCEKRAKRIIKAYNILRNNRS